MTSSARASGGRGENPAATPRLKSAAWSNLDDTQREVYRSVVGTRSIEISDDDGLPGIPTPSQGAGRGLFGLTERVSALGGTLTSGHHDNGGGWRLAAALPTKESS